jgi:starvation-inducible DNA-binding protein
MEMVKTMDKPVEKERKMEKAVKRTTEISPDLNRRLGVYLADLTVLCAKLHSYHWYVQGLAFFSLHEQFEVFYEKAKADMDELAERMLAIGMKPVASLKGTLELADLEERPDEFGSDMEFVKAVREDFFHMVEETEEAIELSEKAKDDVTNDMMIGFKKYYDKVLWMLDASMVKMPEGDESIK